MATIKCRFDHYLYHSFKLSSPAIHGAGALPGFSILERDAGSSTAMINILRFFKGYPEGGPTKKRLIGASSRMTRIPLSLLRGSRTHDPTDTGAVGFSNKAGQRRGNSRPTMLL